MSSRKKRQAYRSFHERRNRVELRKSPKSGKKAQRLKLKEIMQNNVEDDSKSSMVFANLLANELHGQICADIVVDGGILEGSKLRAIEDIGADIEVENRDHLQTVRDGGSYNGWKACYINLYKNGLC